MRRVITINAKLSDEAKQILIDNDFKPFGNKYVNYDSNIKQIMDMSIKFHNLDLHLDDVTKWVQGEPVINNELNQGYRCPLCNGLDAQPNLKCVKNWNQENK